MKKAAAAFNTFTGQSSRFRY